MKKTHKVVMLPTKEVGRLTLWNNDELMLSEDSYRFNSKECIYQHLYIISDDKIKEGDWYINLETNQSCNTLKYDFHKVVTERFPSIYKKIVATTDESIGYTDHRISPVPNFCDYPQLPESFIQAFIKAYNEGKPITEVDLEIQKACCKNGHILINCLNTCKDVIFTIKTRPDNTVIIHQSKMYSKKEVEKLCEKAFRAGREAQNNLNGNKCPSAWIQDNL